VLVDLVVCPSRGVMEDTDSFCGSTSKASSAMISCLSLSPGMEYEKGRGEREGG